MHHSHRHLWKGEIKMTINYLNEKIYESNLRMGVYAESMKAYYEHTNIGRYSVHALLYADGGFQFNLYRGGVLKAIISNTYWYIGKLDGEGHNLATRLLKAYGRS